MSGKLISFSPEGEHNEHLEQSGTRIKQGGTWKKQRVVMLVPAGEKIDTIIALAWRGLIFPPNQPVHIMGAVGYEVGDAYSESIQEILNHPVLGTWEYILTVEHDNAPPADGVVKLIARMEQHPELSCIGGLYWTKGEGGVPQIWGDPNDPVLNYRPQPPDLNDGLVECCGTGMGFNLWRMDMFRDQRLPRPLFKTYTGLEGRGVGTQDLTFWSNARGLGYRCAVDCGVRVGHYDSDNKRMW